MASGPDFTRVAGQAVKGVANISSLQVVRTPNSPFAADPFFRYFFGEGDDLFGSRDRRSLSLGSGVVISSDGYVVTNNHVVGENMREITVALPDKREVRGRLIGTDPATDIALLKLNVSGLPVVPWGDSSKLQIGEWVLAIGSPFQLSATVTAGIVSATGRTNVGFADYEDFIQTDAAINPGNSGGALINTRGELVGINTGIFSQSGGYQGIGFAVPSNLARHVIDDLLKYGEVRRGSIDFRVESMTDPEVAEQVGASSTQGRTGHADVPQFGVLRGRAPARRRHHRVQRSDRRGCRAAAEAGGRREDRDDGHAEGAEKRPAGRREDHDRIERDFCFTPASLTPAAFPATLRTA